MSQAEFHRHVGAENILPNVTAALTRAEDGVADVARIVTEAAELLLASEQ